MHNAFSELFASLRVGVKRRPGLVGLNLTMLTVGLVFVFLTLHENGRRQAYDQWIPDSEKIFRLEGLARNMFGAEEYYLRSLPGPVAGLVKRSLPEIVRETSRLFVRSALFRLEGSQKDVFEARLGYADDVFGRLFELPTLYGDLETALASPNAITLTAPLAKRLFGRENVIGEVVEIVEGDDPAPKTIAAVLKALPEETHFDFEALVSIGGNLPADANPFPERWLSFNMSTYVKTRRPISAGELTNRLSDGVVSRFPSVSAGEKIYVLKDRLDIRATPIVGFELYSPALLARGESFSQRLAMIRAFAFLILGIIVVNYANTATALGVARSREIAVRKAVGASPLRVFGIFLAETALLVLVAAGLAALLAPPVTGAIHKITGFGSGAFGWQFIDTGVLVGLVLGLSVLLGIVPALRLIRLPPARELSTGFSSGTSPWGRRIHTGLVLMQFTGTAAAMLITLTFYHQWQHLAHEDPGFDTAGLYAVWNAREAYGSRLAFLEALRDIKGVTHISQSEISPPRVPRNTWTFTRPGMDGQVKLLMNPVDEAFAETYRLALLAGRFFEPGRALDEVADYRESRNVVVTDRARRILGFTNPQAAIGRRILVLRRDERVPVTIIGVIADAAFEGMRKGFEPRVFFNVGPLGGGRVTLRYAGNDPAAMRASVSQVWQKFVNVAPIEFGAIETALADTAQEERTEAIVAGLSAVLALFFSMLGLYGLAALLLNERRREIALRKLFGARASDLAVRMMGVFVWPAIAGSIVAAPLAGLYLTGWLAQYPERVTLSPILFLTVALATLGVSLLAVAIHLRRGLRLRPASVLSGG